MTGIHTTGVYCRPTLKQQTTTKTTCSQLIYDVLARLVVFNAEKLIHETIYIDDSVSQNISLANVHQFSNFSL